MSLESEGKEMSRLSTHIHTDRHVNIELEFCETEFAITLALGALMLNLKLSVSSGDFIQPMLQVLTSSFSPYDDH